MATETVQVTATSHLDRALQRGITKATVSLADQSSLPPSPSSFPFLPLIHSGTAAWRSRSYENTGLPLPSMNSIPDPGWRGMSIFPFKVRLDPRPLAPQDVGHQLRERRLPAGAIRTAYPVTELRCGLSRETCFGHYSHGNSQDTLSCFAIGLRSAGSGDKVAYECILTYLDHLCFLGAPEVRLCSLIHVACCFFSIRCCVRSLACG